MGPFREMKTILLINVVYGQYYQGDAYYDYYNLNDLNDSYYGDTYYGDAYNPTYDYDVYSDINATSIGQVQNKSQHDGLLFEPRWRKCYGLCLRRYVYERDGLCV